MTTEPVPGMLHAWSLYLQASEEARRRGDRRVGTDDVLLALFDDPTIEGVLGVTLAHARAASASLDRQALGLLGIKSDIDVPELAMRPVPKKPRLRDVAQKDRVRMTPAAKKVLEEAAKSSRRRIMVASQQVLAQIIALEPPDPAAILLSALGVNAPEIRSRIDASARNGAGLGS